MLPRRLPERGAGGAGGAACLLCVARDQQRISYDRCGSSMCRTLARVGVYVLLKVLLLRVRRVWPRQVIRPRIAREACQVSPVAKALLESCNRDLLVSYRPLALFGSGLKPPLKSPIYQSGTHSYCRTQSLSAAAAVARVWQPFCLQSKTQPCCLLHSGAHRLRREACDTQRWPHGRHSAAHQ